MMRTIETKRLRKAWFLTKYPGHARAKSLIERFNKRNEVRPKVIQTNHSKDTEFNDVRVREKFGGNVEESEGKRMGTIASELIESTGTSYWLLNDLEQPSNTHAQYRIHTSTTPSSRSW